ncbi:MAG TPA: cytochrome c biogenesis protein CcdA [Gemmatimonadaceae bacterium]|jgi:thiol:disulfide interchange protein|nr:cytochrome c biogenesis protein CcdA [Gemmatimonadaceae bacterium]
MNAPFLWLAASTGVLSLLTPCVFPMIPVTVAYFSSEHHRHRPGYGAAVLFGLGIVGTFTVLGLVLAALFGAAGLTRFAADPAVNLILAFLFLLFAASLFGWLNLRLPWRLLTAADKSAQEISRGSSLGALVMGATFTLTSVTCTAPFVGTLLVLAAQGAWFTPVVGMLVYSTAFAIPFILLAIAPRYVARLPRSGEWIRTLRVVIGLMEVAAAIKFISNADMVLGWRIFTRAVVLSLWTGLALVAAIYLARHRAQRGQAYPTRLRGVVPGLLALIVAIWLGTGIGGRPIKQLDAYLPPTTTSSSFATASLGESWILNDYARAIGAARTSGKLVFVDFTGYTCTNCRWMEANIFSRPDVSAELNRFVLARLYTDGEGPIYEQQQAFQEKSFGTVALPLYAIVDGEGKIRATFSGLTRDPSEFIRFLQRGQS